MVKTKFAGFYRPTSTEFVDLWKKAIFILDANILLNLYRYPTATRDELLSVFGQVARRLWVPYQAALEYQRNRPKVIAEQKRRFQEVRDSVEKLLHQLEGEVSKLRHRHALIDPDALIAAIKPEIEKYKARLDELEQTQGNVHDEDALRDRIDNLFQGRVGPVPEKETLARIYKDGEHRYKYAMPPGYADEGKAKSPDAYYSYNGLCYEARYGDLTLWMQILDYAKTNPGSSIIFLTDDDKEDWWWSVESQGKKKLGPRPELVAEMKEVGQAAEFYMYNFQKFLEYSKNYLGSKVSDKSIDAVKEVSKRRRKALFYEPHVIQLILEWVRTHYSDDDILRSVEGADFIRLEYADEERRQVLAKTAYIVRGMRSQSVGLIVDGIESATVWIRSRPSFSGMTVVFVCSNDENAYQISSELPTYLAGVDDAISLVVGYVRADDEGKAKAFVDVFQYNLP